MSSDAARSALAHLDGWTWLVAEYRVWLITLATVAGLAVPLLVAASKHLPRPAPSLVIRSGAMALAFSAATVTVCSLLHFSDLRWLAPGQRPGRIPGNPGISPHRYRLRVPGASGLLLGGHNLAPCPPRRYQADRARRDAQVNHRVRAEIVIGCP